MIKRPPSPTTWKLTLEYDGTRYSGWQEQKNARTVAGELRQAAEEFLGGKIDLGGSGRTDAGVHALAQVAHLKTTARNLKSGSELVRALNARLPADIAVLDAELAPRGFHARHHALSRGYVYQISTRKNAFLKRQVWWVKEALSVDAMSQAAAQLPGRHDFICFRAEDHARPDESTIVVVDSASVEQENDLILFRIEASHFLWRMVRRLVGVLVKTGAGEVAPSEWTALLEGKCSPGLDVAAWTAPASGLFLEGVRYSDDPHGS